MLHKSGRRPCHKTFTMRYDNEIRSHGQEVFFK
jgi:hypothetical protein